jgi:hypothetical protein
MRERDICPSEIASLSESHPSEGWRTRHSSNVWPPPLEGCSSPPRRNGRPRLLRSTTWPTPAPFPPSTHGCRGRVFPTRARSVNRPDARRSLPWLESQRRSTPAAESSGRITGKPGPIRRRNPMTRTGGYCHMRGKIPDPQLNPHLAMSCTTCAYLGSPRAVVSRCKTCPG